MVDAAANITTTDGGRGQPTDDDSYEEENYEAPQQLAPYRELPVYGVPPPDRTWLLESVLRDLENGVFHGAALLADGMRRDARIVTCFEQCQSSVFGAERAINGEAEEIVEKCDAYFPKLFTRSALEELDYHATMLGVGVAEMRWNTRETPWCFRTKIWHPQYVQWRWDLEAYTLITADRGLIRLPRPGERSSRWFLYTPYGFERAFLYGRIRALVIPWLLRNWTYDDWGSFLEIHGHPMRQAIIPNQGDPKEEKEYVRSIANVGANTVIKSRQNANGDKYDLKIIEAMSRGECFAEAKAACEKDIAGILVGQAMSIDGVGGLGSQENAGAPTRLDISQSRSQKLGETISDGPLRVWIYFNFGEQEEYPVVGWNVAPEENQLDRARTNLTQAQADKVNIDNGVVTPEEIRQSRFAGGFSLDTQIDPALDPAVLDAQRQAAADMKQPFGGEDEADDDQEEDQADEETDQEG